MTLLEVMGATLLVALAWSVMAVGLSKSSGATALLQAEATVTNFDRTCRELAAVEGRIALTGADGGRILMARRADDGRILGSRGLPRGVCCVLRPRVGRGDVTFDRAGRSQDYRVVLEGPNQARTWWTSGVTGWRTVEDGQ